MILLEADLTSGRTAGLDQLPVAMRELRARMLGMVEGLDDDAWRAPSRCERWTVHDVVRHVRDVSHRLVARLQDDNAAEVPPAFDNRVTPQQCWTPGRARTRRGPSPSCDPLFEAEGPALAGRLAAGSEDQVMGPYGPVHWTVLVAHVLWDGWLHVRDIGGQSSTHVEDGVVALYALLIASVPARFGGFPLDVSVDLTSSDGRHLQAAVAPGHVTVCDAVPTAPRTYRANSGLWSMPSVDGIRSSIGCCTATPRSACPSPGCAWSWPRCKGSGVVVTRGPRSEVEPTPGNHDGISSFFRDRSGAFNNRA